MHVLKLKRVWHTDLWPDPTRPSHNRWPSDQWPGSISGVCASFKIQFGTAFQLGGPHVQMHVMMSFICFHTNPQGRLSPLNMWSKFPIFLFLFLSDFPALLTLFFSPTLLPHVSFPGAFPEGLGECSELLLWQHFCGNVYHIGTALAAVVDTVQLYLDSLSVCIIIVLIIVVVTAQLSSSSAEQCIQQGV